MQYWLKDHGPDQARISDQTRLSSNTPCTPTVFVHMKKNGIAKEAIVL